MLLYRDGEGVLRERFEAALRYVDRVDVLVGFFWFSGLKVFEEALRAHPEVRLRVLVGMAADVWRGQVVELAPETAGKDDAALAGEAYARLGRVLGSGIGETRQDAGRRAFFAELLAAGRLEVRQTRRPNHAKVWLFHTAPEHREGLVEGRLITGSSNFSRAALKGETQDELDVELWDWGYAEAQAWFDRLWEEAVPLEAGELARRLGARAPLSPYEAFALALDTVVRAEPEDVNLPARIKRELEGAKFREFAYQVDAVVQACGMLEAYGGALVADVVGLGKSLIAMLVAAASDFGQTGIILCPPGLVANWEGYRKAFGLGPTRWPIYSSGNLDKVKKDLEEDPGFRMVIVDEAHRFRNAEGKGYADLQTICRGRKVLLLTATPLNNRMDDLAALLGLFLPLRNNPLVYGGDLQGYLKAIGKRLKECQAALLRAKLLDAAESAAQALGLGTLVALGVDKLLAQNLRGREETVKVIKRRHDHFLGQVRDLLEKVTIRRNRLDLLEDPIYRKTLPALSKVCDPTREYFALDDAQDAFYDRIVTEVFGGLTPLWLAPVYQPEDYMLPKPKADATQGNIRDNMRRMLVRRFESSFAAFAQSLENMCAMYRNAEGFVLKTNRFFYDREAMEKLMEIADPEAFQEAYEAVEAELLKQSEEGGKKTSVYYMDSTNFNGKTFLEAIRTDIMLFGALQKEMKRLGLLANDPKSARLVEVCRDILAGKALKDSNPAAPKRKILIFSEFADTVAFLSKRLEAAFPGRVCVVRDLGTAKREELRANFDASCPKAQQRDDFDILLGTDKISEGLNLNRAGVVVNYDIPWNPTRVLQRLGRINRIGGKVFEELHTVNFFPTKRGADLVGNERIAREKLFNIQKTLGEDVKLFDEGEEPTPAELWERLNGNKEEAGAITKWRGLHAELARRDPELFARVRERAPNAKSARAAAPGIAPGTYQLRTIGALPQALAVSPEGATHAIAPTALLEALRCEPNEPLDKTAVHGKAFWDALSTLANYRDASPAWVSPTFGAARDNLALVEQRAPALAADVRAVRKALNEGRLANWWVRQLAKRPFSHDTATEAEIATYAKTLRGVLADFRLAGTAASEPPRPVTQLSVALSGPEQDQFR